MIELPEAVVTARQVTATLRGKTVARAEANHTPHGFAWYTGDPAQYDHLLAGQVFGSAEAYASNVEIEAGDKWLVISAPIRYHQPGAKLPPKHQLLVQFTDGSAITVTIQMWGGMFCFPMGQKGGFPDYDLAKERPSPLSDDFTRAYFNSLYDAECGKLSAKEFLATKQRIPGLGNGVLQDMLWTAKIHPRRKMGTLSDQERGGLYDAVTGVMRAMTEQGGRDTEKDIFGRPGGYVTILSKNTAGKPCPACGTIIIKEPYMGGSIYYCQMCQPL